MDKTEPWNSLRNVVLGLAVIAGGVAGFVGRYCANAPYTAQWRRDQYAASSQQPDISSRTTGAGATVVQ